MNFKQFEKKLSTSLFFNTKKFGCVYEYCLPPEDCEDGEPLIIQINGAWPEYNGELIDLNFSESKAEEISVCLPKCVEIDGQETQIQPCAGHAIRQLGTNDWYEYQRVYDATPATCTSVWCRRTCVTHRTSNQIIR